MSPIRILLANRDGVAVMITPSRQQLDADLTGKARDAPGYGKA